MKKGQSVDKGKSNSNKFMFLFRNKVGFVYCLLMVCVLAITTIGATYAYWVATAESASNTVQTKSTIYSISMQINPLYHDFSVIPMNDKDVLKALKNRCKDKYDRGACSAYYIYVYDYSENLDYISGYMDVETDNMQNLSYMMLRLSDVYDEEQCIKVGESEDIYCIAHETTAIGDGVNLSLGDSYDVKGMADTKFILVMWLSNFKYSQNDVDIGSFNATVTMQAGNGGEIKGTIAEAIKISNDTNMDMGDNNG